jgi:hypothetical protein
MGDVPHLQTALAQPLEAHSTSRLEVVENLGQAHLAAARYSGSIRVQGMSFSVGLGVDGSLIARQRAQPGQICQFARHNQGQENIRRPRDRSCGHGSAEEEQVPLEEERFL